ncbi:MAG TPA: hypothetical protein ENH41_04080, partial [Candidatus Omnitrophica bacterium]|nr:hypothetical protein [Candidatus Omnitrophota bacterium]
MRKVISLFILICFFCNAVGFAQITPSAANSGVLYTAPLLRYLSVNSANPFNYFNFLVDKGSVSSLALNRETKKLINYFFLGLSLSNQSLWVNLRPDEPRRITSDELSRTDMGRVLLEQDLQLKKDVARYMHPSNSHGKEFWNKLYAKIGKDKVKKSKVATSSRVWIVPDEAVIVETEDGALIAEAKLKVMLENEYLKQNPADKIQKFSEDLMKEIVLPVLSNDVNTSLRYAPLRQIYHSLILAEWYKQKHRSSGSVFSLCIDRGYTNGLESQLPWSKQKIWQEYVNSYQNGEYKIKDTIFDLKRMYFSGGIIFNFETASSAIVSSGAGLGNLASRSVKAVSAASSIKIVSISDLIPDRPEDTNLLKGLTSDLVVTGATSPIFNNEMPDLEFSLASSPMERDSRNISLDKLIGEVASRLRASEEIVDIRVLLETGKTLKLYDREKTLFNDYVIKIAIETGALDSINNIDWVEFANKVWLAAQLSPNDVVIAAERELVNQQGILELYSSDFIPVFDSERFPEGTMRVSGSLPLEKRKQLGVVDKARRIMRFTEKDQVEILENIDEYVEHPAQRAVKEIVEKFEGEPYLSNAYAGEYLKGVWWRTKNGNRYFTPLTIRDYAEESGYEVLNTIIESGVMQVDLPINAQFVSSAMEEEIENFFDRLDGLKRRDLLSDKVGSVPMVSDILIKALGLPGGLIADEGRSELLRAVIRDNLSGAFLNNKIRNFISDARGVLAEKRQDFELIEYENINAAVDLLGELINSSSSAMKGIQGLREKDFKAFLEVNMLDIFKQV